MFLLRHSKPPSDQDDVPFRYGQLEQRMIDTGSKKLSHSSSSIAITIACSGCTIFRPRLSIFGPVIGSLYTGTFDLNTTTSLPSEPQLDQDTTFDRPVYSTSTHPDARQAPNMPVVTARFLGLVALSAVILLSIPNIRTIIHILHHLTGSSEIPVEIPDSSYTTSKAKEQLIPKIIHQIHHSREHPSNETSPTTWDDMRQACNTTNADFEYKLWTTNSSHEFIKTHYKWFLEAYDSYEHHAQRVNTLRYFVMRHYGGIYVAPDYSCARGLEPLLFHPAWTLERGHGTTGARPNHPYWIMMTESLVSHGKDSQSPLLNITQPGGPEFEEAIWDKYQSTGLSTNKRDEDHVFQVKVGHQGGSFFTPTGGFRYHGPGCPASVKALLVCLLLFAILTVWLAHSWQARKTHQREYQKLLPAEDNLEGYGAV
ncbi:hypothetical protein B0T20DRAFT_220009 [Sordaria brevicollis]|uniref:Uncharacterized protein n=1 Tax=Sordaria brevicollis TaxID=83679 RepID=A0AAE0PFA9_SORBR|nr:hypothetical protein B0T20DRAFT_220009 [Sordaria brevicollis]